MTRLRAAGYLIAAAVFGAALACGPTALAEPGTAGGATGVAGAAALQGETGWYGYAVTGKTYTSTTADWTMPSLSCGTSGDENYVEIWTGLDGYSSDTVEQIGAAAQCEDRTTYYAGWYDLYPSEPVDFSNTLRPGDQLDAAVSYASGTFTLTLKDATQGWTQTVTKAVAGAARSSAESVVGAPSTLSCEPAETLAAFTGDTVDGKALESQDPIAVTGGDPYIVVSPANGGQFTVTCKSAP